VCGEVAVGVFARWNEKKKTCIPREMRIGFSLEPFIIINGQPKSI